MCAGSSTRGPATRLAWGSVFKDCGRAMSGRSTVSSRRLLREPSKGSLTLPRWAPTAKPSPPDAIAFRSSRAVVLALVLMVVGSAPSAGAADGEARVFGLVDLSSARAPEKLRGEIERWAATR